MLGALLSGCEEMFGTAAEEVLPKVTHRTSEVIHHMQYPIDSQ